MQCVLFICVLCEKKYVIPYLSLCHSVLQKSPVSLRHSVILSSKKHLSPSVTLLFCLQKKHLSPFVIMSLCLQKNISLPLRPSVILSSKKHLSPFVIMSLCLQKNICLSPSLCYSVFKKHLSPFVIMSLCLQKNICLSLSLCHYVFKKISVSLSVPLLFCLQKNICLPLSLCHSVFKKISVSLSVPLLFCLKTPQLGTEADPAVVVVISFLSVLYQYFISCATSSPTTFLQYILFYKVVEITSCGILRTVSYLVPLRGIQLSFKTIEEHVKHLSLSVV